MVHQQFSKVNNMLTEEGITDADQIFNVLIEYLVSQSGANMQHIACNVSKTFLSFKSYLSLAFRKFNLSLYRCEH